MPQKSCDLNRMPTPVFCDCLDEIIPIVTSIINNSLSSGIVWPAATMTTRKDAQLINSKLGRTHMGY